MSAIGPTHTPTSNLMAILNPPPPGMMRMNSGLLVPISKLSGGAAQKQTEKLLIVLSYYEGDREIAEDLATLIADLERTRNRETDFMIVRRGDARVFDVAVVEKLKSKFYNVLTHTCRRSDAKGYPMGPNQMFSDLVSLMGTTYRSDYYAFLNLETDAVPTRPGWIAEIIAAWSFFNAKGAHAIGFIHDNPRPHLNGMAVYSTDIAQRAGGNRLMGCDPQICYDIAFANMILPHAAATPLIYFKYRQETITATDLFGPKNEGIVPALYHGVKDGSARAAVRARHITFTDRPEPVIIVHKLNDVLQLSEIESPTSFELEPQTLMPSGEPGERPNVYTYHSIHGRPSAESLAIIEAWRKGWTTRGWNPVVLTIRDAATHARFDELSEAIDRLPYVGDRKKQQAMFYRWLALDLKGGGLMVGNDVLPKELTPDKISAFGESEPIYSDRDDHFVGMWLSLEQSKMWINQVISYDAQPEDVLQNNPHVSDGTIVEFAPMFDDFEGRRHSSRDMVISFASQGTGKERASVAMEEFLANPVST